MNNLLQRLITGLVAGSVAIAAVFWSAYGLWLFCLIVSVLGLYEFLGLRERPVSYRWAAVLGGSAVWAGVLLLLILDQWADKQALLWQALPLLLPLLSLFLLFQEKEKNPLSEVGAFAMGFWYCFLPMLLLFALGLSSGEYDFRIPLGILILTWGLDVGSYFSGRALGRRPLFPRISPKKTWEGSIGGGLVCLGLAWAFSTMPFTSDQITFDWLIVGGIIAVFSQLGDLVESMYKRSIAIKDSGSILPGHGGFLDRFDGTYFSIPIIFLYFSWL
jgi:phosphatidate cytidylyltransferase